MLKERQRRGIARAPTPKRSMEYGVFGTMAESRLCVISTNSRPPALQTPFFKFLEQMNVNVSVLQLPCGPEYLNDARPTPAVAQIQWKWMFSPRFYKQIIDAQGWISCAITVSHLRGVHQCCSCAEMEKPIILMIEDDAEFTSDAETGFIRAAIALKELEEQNKNEVDIVWCTHSTHAFTHLARVVEARPYYNWARCAYVFPHAT